MTLAELGIVRGYGGIWHEIDYSEEQLAEEAKKPKKVYKYERVLDYDVEDKVLKDGIFFVPSDEAKKKYFIDGDALYKLVNPDGELFDWMKGKDPLKK